jgi:hypothetical protein
VPKTPRLEYLFHGKVKTDSIIGCHSRSKDFLEIRGSIKAHEGGQLYISDNRRDLKNKKS